MITNESEIPPAPTNFRLLEKEIKKHGFTYVQLERTPTVALYAVKSEFGGTLGYEIIRIRIAPATFMKINNTWIPEREAYPGSEEFGQRGWYYPAEYKAEAYSRYAAEKVRVPDGQA